MYRSLRLALPVLFFITAVAAPLAGQTNIGGIINIYTPVTGIACSSVEVVSAKGFQAGDKVLLVQMQGAVINNTESPDYGKIIRRGGAGNYEFLRIAEIRGNIVLFDYRITGSYEISAKVQLVRVPDYDVAQISSPLTCEAWNGQTGAILVFMADFIIMNADIDVGDKGFRGGIVANRGYPMVHSRIFAGPVDPPNTALKGEGIAHTFLGTMVSGRGAPANGGGGGTNHNGGGGGGALGGCGGNGGKAYNHVKIAGDFSLSQGLGGYPLPLANDRIYPGGGGGAGHTNDGSGSNGGNGAGIVFILAKSLKGNNHSIRANGSDTRNAGIDGAGGGGAGGQIILEIDKIESVGTISVLGGTGGNALSSSYGCHGVGGGGGGGIIYAKSALPSTTAILLEGGACGNCDNTLHGAGPGCPGIVLNSFRIVEAFVKSTNVSLGNDTTLCDIRQIVLTPGANFISYLWQNGSSAPTFTADKPGQYWVRVTDAAGCTTSDTINIYSGDDAPVHLGPDTLLCSGEPYLLSPEGIFKQLLWSDGSTGHTLKADRTGQYWVMATGFCGNVSHDTVNIRYRNTVPPDLGRDTLVCPGMPVILRPQARYLSYEWSDNSRDSLLTVTKPGTYTLKAADSCGRVYTDAITVANFERSLSVIERADICEGDTIPLPANGAVQYLWSPGTYLSDSAIASPLAFPDRTTTFHVVAIDKNGCVQEADVLIIVNPKPRPNLPGTINICEGREHILDAEWPGASYLWSDGSRESKLRVNKAGKYWVRVISGNCIVSDTVDVTFGKGILTMKNDTSICAGSGLSLSAEFGRSFSWEPREIFDTPDAKNATARPTKDVRITLTVTDDNGCEYSGSMNVHVLPELSFSSPESLSVCRGGSLSVTLQGKGAYVYSWSPAEGIISAGADSSQVELLPDKSISYTITAKSMGCELQKQLHVRVFDNPVVIAGPDTTVCSGSLLQLHAEGAQNYEWSPGADFDDPSQADPFLRPKKSGWYYVKGSDNKGCESRDSVYVITEPETRIECRFIENNAEYLPGEDFGFRIQMKNSNPLAGMRNFRLRLRYDPRLIFFSPKHSIDAEGDLALWSITKAEDYGLGIMTVEGTGEREFVEGSLMLSARLMLSVLESLSAPVRIISFSTDAPGLCMSVDTTHGELKLNPFCFYGGRNVEVGNRSFSLAEPSPNPLTGSELPISFSLGFECSAVLELYNAMGEQVYRMEEYLEADGYRTMIDIGNYAAGLYFYRLSAGPFSETKSFVLQR